MPKPQITNLSDEIMSKIIEHLGKESAWYLGPFLRTGKQAIYYEGLHRATSLGLLLDGDLHSTPRLCCQHQRT
ncbi:unnamed protein product [Brassica napus]|uniref:(rape) hypothetical protein n=1 Tax=Brassica napus TaxID=3708 RepID=A0A816JH98_BRANA|nr:unnamed protein product [Brassica napus]